MTCSDAPDYRLSKMMLNTMTSMLQREVSQYNILINAVDPGWAHTDMSRVSEGQTPEEVRGYHWRCNA